MRPIVSVLAFVIPTLFLRAADSDRAALAEEYLSIREAHSGGRVNEMWPKVRSDVAKYVAEAFTEDELRGIIAFYKSPAGLALLTKEPKIEQRMLTRYLAISREVYEQRVEEARVARESLPPDGQNPTPAPAATPSPVPVPKALPPQNSVEFATVLLDEVRLLHAAADQWGIETKQRKGKGVPTLNDVLVYLRPGSRLRTSLESGRCVDALGNPIKLEPFGSPPTISRRSVDQLSAIVPLDFWRPFKIE